MTNQNETQTAVIISASAIFFAALIGIGFCVLVATFGGAVTLSFFSEVDNLPSSHTIALIASLLVVILTFAFLVAGFIASKASHQQYRFDSIVHSLATWALMAVLLMFLVSGVATVDGIRRGISGIKAPRLVTNVELLKSKAVTTISGGGFDKGTKEQRQDDTDADFILKIALWISFSSLLLGSGASVAGGLLGRKREPK